MVREQEELGELPGSHARLTSREGEKAGSWVKASSNAVQSKKSSTRLQRVLEPKSPIRGVQCLPGLKLP